MLDYIVMQMRKINCEKGFCNKTKQQLLFTLEELYVKRNE